MAEHDDGHPISYHLLEPGVPVHAADGAFVGTVAQVLDNVEEGIFDGIVLDTPAGARFADAPEVARITDRLVTLTLDGAAAAELPPPEPGAPRFKANARPGRLGRLFGGGWKRH